MTEKFNNVKKESIQTMFLGTSSMKERCLNHMNEETFITKRIESTKHLIGKKKKIKPEIISLEVYNLEKLLAMKSYLEDFVIFDSYRQNDKKGKYTEQLNIINKIIEESLITDYFIQGNKFYRIMGFTYNYSERIGRLYSYLTTMTRLTREVRFYLFQDLYLDVDIINAHPSILLQFARNHKINTPELNKLVESRETFYDQVSQNLKCEISDVKSIIIRLINLTKEEFFHDQNIGVLENLFYEILEIRDKIFDIESTKISQALSGKRSYKKKGIDKKKVSIQTFYCQTVESQTILDLYTFLKTKEGIDGSFTNNFIPLIFIPFFDGAYVRYHNPVTQSQVKDFIEEYNNRRDIIKFKIKKIEKDQNLLYEETFKAHLVLTNYLKNMPITTGIRILEKLDLKEAIFSEEEFAYIVNQANNLRKKNEELSEEIELHRESSTKAKKGSPERDRLKKELDALLLERKKTYRYFIPNHEADKITLRVKYRMLALRLELLKYAQTEKTLADYISNLIKEPETNVK
jgi:hypothetical protein